MALGRLVPRKAPVRVQHEERDPAEPDRVEQDEPAWVQREGPGPHFGRNSEYCNEDNEGRHYERTEESRVREEARKCQCGGDDEPGDRDEHHRSAGCVLGFCLDRRKGLGMNRRKLHTHCRPPPCEATRRDFAGSVTGSARTRATSGTGRVSIGNESSAVAKPPAISTAKYILEAAIAAEPKAFPSRTTTSATPNTAPICRIDRFTALPTPKRSAGRPNTAAPVSDGMISPTPAPPISRPGSQSRRNPGVGPILRSNQAPPSANRIPPAINSGRWPRRAANLPAKTATGMTINGPGVTANPAIGNE